MDFSHIIEFSGAKKRVTARKRLARATDCLHGGSQLGFGAAQTHCPIADFFVVLERNEIGDGLHRLAQFRFGAA
nr:hypothetical protein [Variovorax paradoxus]